MVWAPRDLKIEALQQKTNPFFFSIFYFWPAHEPEASKLNNRTNKLETDQKKKDITTAPQIRPNNRP